MSHSIVSFQCLCGIMVSEGDMPCDIPECRLRDEAGHFINCGDCGQAIDCRDLGEVFRHEEPGHEARRLS